jgi:hypothetical protein
LQYVERCSPLLFLSVRGCLRDGDSEGISAVADFVGRANNIDGLDLGGEGDFRLKSGLVKLFEDLKKNDKIATLDVSGHRYGNDILDLVASLLSENEWIDRVSLDDNGVDNVAALRQLIARLKGATRHVRIALPMNDLHRASIPPKEIAALQAEIDAVAAHGNPSPRKKTTKLIARGSAPIAAPGSAVLGTSASPLAGISGQISAQMAGTPRRGVSLERRATMKRTSAFTIMAQDRFRASGSESEGQLSTQSEDTMSVSEVDGEFVVKPRVAPGALVDPHQQLALDYVHEEYVLDSQWEAMIDDIPDTDVESLFVGLLAQCSTEALLYQMDRPSG